MTAKQYDANRSLKGMLIVTKIERVPLVEHNDGMTIGQAIDEYIGKSVDQIKTLTFDFPEE